MEKNPEFDDIRPYYDEEVVPVIEKLLADPEFQKVIRRLFPDREWNEFETAMRQVKTRRDFQHGIITDSIHKIVGKTVDSMECTGFENIVKGTAYTYMSNHRDIVLDAALLAIMLVPGGHEIMEIAIGDNLLLHPWIEDLVRLNKSFIVKRDICVRRMFEVSSHLSKYIHFTIRNKKESVWIAQREGRAKDSNDKTQESVLKMLALGGENGFVDNIRALNIAPVSLSYEYDPCDYLKAKEFQQKRDDPDFRKSKEDDLLNMQTGILGYKGHVHFQIGRPINPAIDQLDQTMHKNEWAGKIASLIDKEIYLNYRFFSGNYVAYDALWGKGRLTDRYTSGDKKNFEEYIGRQLNKIELKNKDEAYLKEKLLEMYAYPVKNHLEAAED